MVKRKLLTGVWRIICVVWQATIPKEWSKWLALAENWYNTNFHTLIQTTPYEVVYGQKPPLHIPYLPHALKVNTVDRSLVAHETALHLIQHNLHRVQQRMKHLVDRKRTERHFEVGDMVYVKLQPYRQHSLKDHSCQKLSPRYFGPYSVVEKIGTVAYRLQLPSQVKIHPTFHVSLLKSFKK